MMVHAVRAWSLGLLRLLACACWLVATPALAAGRTLTLDDVFDMQRIERVAPSPDGERLLVVVSRPARAGEVYGRTFYETDTSRDDVWLIARKTGEARNLTGGQTLAAGSWCPVWSPDGRRAALLSTRPEKAEPHGGDNVRLYIWDAATGALSRLSDDGAMTQTHYGSPMYQLDVRADGAATTCGPEENAPFVWVDDRHLLAIMLPPGGISGLIDEQQRSHRAAAETPATLRDGLAPTMTAVGSGAERDRAMPPTPEMRLRLFDVEAGTDRVVGTLPVYPFYGATSLSLSPDRSRLALLATTGMVPPSPGQAPPYPKMPDWAVQKRLGFASLSGGGVRWMGVPPEAALPLDLYDWSPDGRSVAFRARRMLADAGAPLFVAAADGEAVQRLGPTGLAVGDEWVGGHPLLWTRDGDALALLHDPAHPPVWWLIRRSGAAQALPDAPATLHEARGHLFGVTGDRLLEFDLGQARWTATGAPLPFAGTDDESPAGPGLMVLRGAEKDGKRPLALIGLNDPAWRARLADIPADGKILFADRRGVLWSSATRQGFRLQSLEPGDRQSRSLLALNAYLADVDWGTTRLVDYRAADGQAVQAGVILPPGYRPGQRLPTLFWIYPGTRRRDLDYWLDPAMAGLYNLYLYAARGYAVVVPQMPVDTSNPHATMFADIPKGLMPAAQRMIDLGIANPDALGVFGQSYGGYAVYSVVTQSQRFRAAVAIAGITDLSSDVTAFDPSARGYPGIEHERSYNWGILRYDGGATIDADPLRYMLGSPIQYVDRVTTPLLMIHGEKDARGQLSQAEAFFYRLYQQGKTARLLRYWGENHGIALSPANERSVFDETVAWFDRYLRGGGR